MLEKDAVVRAGMVEQIKREISILQTIRHPNIVSRKRRGRGAASMCFSLWKLASMQAFFTDPILHPQVNLHEVMASRDKIYLVMELVTGGELFDKVAAEGPMKVALGARELGQYS